jgi:hypothetical protein
MPQVDLFAVHQAHWVSSKFLLRPRLSRVFVITGLARDLCFEPWTLRQQSSLWKTRSVRCWPPFHLVPLLVLWKCRGFFNGCGKMRQLIEIASELQAVYDSKRWQSCVIGGLAVQRWGKPRLTRDVDVLCSLALEQNQFISKRFWLCIRDG